MPDTIYYFTAQIGISSVQVSSISTISLSGFEDQILKLASNSSGDVAILITKQNLSDSIGTLYRLTSNNLFGTAIVLGGLLSAESAEHVGLAMDSSSKVLVALSFVEVGELGGSLPYEFIVGESPQGVVESITNIEYSDGLSLTNLKCYNDIFYISYSNGNDNTSTFQTSMTLLGAAALNNFSTIYSTDNTATPSFADILVPYQATKPRFYFYANIPSSASTKLNTKYVEINGLAVVGEPVEQNLGNVSTENESSASTITAILAQDSIDNSNIIAFFLQGSLKLVFYNYITGESSQVYTLSNENITNFQSALTPNGYIVVSWFDSNGQLQTTTINSNLSQVGGDPLINAIKSYCPMKKLKGIRVN